MAKKTKMVYSQSEIGAGTRGASLGVDALVTIARSRKDKYFDEREMVKVENINDSLLLKNKDNNAKYINHYQKTFNTITKTVKKTLNKKADQKLFILSGDHSNAAGFITGIKQSYPKRKLGIVWIDAHADLHTPHTTPSGNIHGMPLSIVTDYRSPKVDKRNLSDTTLKIWADLNKHKTKAPLPKVVFIALRDTESDENEVIRYNKIPIITVEELNRPDGLTNCIEKVKTSLADCDDIYISFDVDSMDGEKVSDGTGTPVPNGLLLEQSKELVQTLFDEIENIKYFEITEINPLLDTKGNSMAEAAYQIMDIALKNLDKK